MHGWGASSGGGSTRLGAQKGHELRVLKWTVALYVLIFALKLSVYLVTGVLALLAEAFHTLSDVFISGFLLLATIWSHKEADEGHMFGHGRAQNVAALVAATLFLSFTSLRLYEEAIPRLLDPTEAEYQSLPLAVGVLLLSMVIAAAPMIGLLRQRRRGAAAKAQLVELVNDELGLLAALFGTLLLMAGYPVADPLAAIVVATIIAFNAIGLIRENIGFLVGRSPDPEVINRLRELACSVRGVLDTHRLRVQYVGPDMLYASIHIRVSKDLSVEEADRIAEEVRERIHGTVDCQYCTIHVDPGGPEHALSEHTGGCGEATQRDGGEVDEHQRASGVTEDTPQEGGRGGRVA